MGTSIPGHDLNRIPSSIFSSKPSCSTPIEWSVASNESLFSIHMGNNSFSRDQAVLPGKSGELTKPDKSSYAKSRQHTETKPVDLNNTPLCLPTVIEGAVGIYRKSGSMGEKVVLKETTEDHIKESMPLAHGPGTPSTTSRLSDGSGNSAKSFAFPVLACEAEKCASEQVCPETLPSNTPEKPQLQRQAQLETPYSSLTRWFSCFSTCCFFSAK
ncbi:uncharacterized protein LOC127804663 [Diospyros lotus]|uniref:uncharacterized protein LOC127804663 n=1 Tax=Diospyros lotus TaxID=55363 RepID=UPI0022594820|nr:uncharacterized protein LOC127804663 [Diospyros lotus]XP_052197534.1 uncharacterized protein LOC127804663 [Diospyros lotus]